MTSASLNSLVYEAKGPIKKTNFVCYQNSMQHFLATLWPVAVHLLPSPGKVYCVTTVVG